ncbi:MAG: hypothetical protein LBU32_32370 [Clostridiales bacterium]|jgi:hypothetical protein|nr:hypothetical protein [Clostridiales bacterium]
MKEGLTEIVFILDRSGSMHNLVSDTIGGYNSFIKNQQEVSGEAILTTVLFDNQYELLHDRVDIKAVSPITSKEYYVRGATALLDALGFSIMKIGDVFNSLPEECRPEKVIFVITTDGQENSSKEYTYSAIRALVEKKKKECEWEFIFLGANMDSIPEAAKLGIQASNAVSYHSDHEGESLKYRSVSKAVSGYRQSHANALPSSWKKEIEEDYKNRKKQRD